MYYVFCTFIWLHLSTVLTSYIYLVSSPYFFVLPDSGNEERIMRSLVFTFNEGLKTFQ
jgi:hypothetical protein